LHQNGRYPSRRAGTRRDARNACGTGTTENERDLLSISEKPVMHHWETRGRRFKSSRSDQKKPRKRALFISRCRDKSTKAKQEPANSGFPSRESREGRRASGEVLARHVDSTARLPARWPGRSLGWAGPSPAQAVTAELGRLTQCERRLPWNIVASLSQLSK
jgi:hypothetical protein